jgi:hypothetical protein
MFEEVKLFGSPEQRIVVQTRKGRDVKNVIEPEPGFQQRQIYQRLLEKYGRQWHPRRPATGGYNCAGHVWASRRTGIFDPSDWRLILDDDGYRRLAPDEQPQPGDLVLYVDNVNAEILHVGMILEMRQGVTPDSPRLPWVLSKWDAKSGEVMHFVRDLPPWEDQGFSVIIQYWTDRPFGEDGAS